MRYFSIFYFIFIFSASLSAAENSTENPDISFILDAGLGYFSSSDHLVQGGHAIDNSGFSLQGVELAVGHSVDPYFRFDMNFQFIGMHIEEVYVTTLSLPWNFQMKAGMINAQFGRENPQHLHAIKFINYSLMHSRFMSSEHFSGIGGELSVLLPLPWYSLILAQVLDTKDGQYFRSSSFATTDYTKSGKLDGPEDMVYVARMENFFEMGSNWGLKIGLSGSWGQSEYVPDNRVSLYGGDLYLKWRNISSGKDSFAFAFTFEVLFRDTQIPESFVTDWGGYAQTDFQINRNWEISLRGDYNDILKGIPVNYEKMPEREIRGSFIIAAMPTHFSKIKLQYDITKEHDKEIAHAAFLQGEFAVGSHGAHTF
ncbi:MAG TPA: hypothetical protein PKG52_00745 [bacterium]|nr:hypothetical protein [bacterium]HPS28968.1 hypothetical protein [bacterium]